MRALNLIIRLGLFALAIFLMWREGQMQPKPGVWFAIAMSLIVVSLLARFPKRLA